MIRGGDKPLEDCGGISVVTCMSVSFLNRPAGLLFLLRHSNLLGSPKVLHRTGTSSVIVTRNHYSTISPIANSGMVTNMQCLPLVDNHLGDATVIIQYWWSFQSRHLKCRRCPVQPPWEFYVHTTTAYRYTTTEITAILWLISVQDEICLRDTTLELIPTKITGCSRLAQ